MGGIFGGGDSGGSSTTEVKLPEYIEKGGKEQYGISRALQKQPYVTYPGPRIAPFTADENAAFGNARQNAGQWAGDLNASRSMINFATQPWSQTTAQQYMSPYTGAVTDIAARETQRAYDTDTAKATNAAAVGAGAFGGARHGVVESENLRNKNQAIADIYARGNDAAYQNAMQGYQNDRGALLTGAQQAAGLGQLGQGLNTADTELLLRSGEYQRAMNQRNLDLGYEDFMRQYQDPWTRQQYALQTLGSVPTPTSSSTETSGSAPGGSPLGQIGGLGLAGLGAYSMFSG